MKSTQTFFDKYAYEFDALYGVPKNPLNFIINPVFRKSMRMRFDKSLRYSDPIPGKTFCDIGCGPGHYSVALAKAGAVKVVGIDFSEEMIKIAQQRAVRENVAHICEFHVADITEYEVKEKFDHSLLMGFMDYVRDPADIMQKVLALTGISVFASFPVENGLLALQRKIRYKNRCPLFMYRKRDLMALAEKLDGCTVTIEKISRDYFVTFSIKDTAK